MTTLPQLILIPGLAGDASMFDTLALPTALRPHVSDVHTAPGIDRIEDMAALLLRQHSGLLVLCGTSMGGMIAMEAVRQAPERVAGLALLGTTARAETPEMRTLREAAIVLFERGEVRPVIEPNLAFAFHPQQMADSALMQRYMDFVLRAGGAQLARQNRAVIHRPHALVHLGSVRCPVLLVCGDSDQLTPPECSREIAQAIPGAELHLLPDCGHMLTMERPAEVSRLLGDWAARQGWSSTALG